MMEIDHENFWIIIVVLTAISSLIIFFIAQSLCSRFKKKPKEIRGKIALVSFESDMNIIYDIRKVK